MSLYYKQKLISGVRDVPSMTLAQYNLLTNKPKLWIRTDAPSGDRGINADDIQYDSNTSVKEKIDGLVYTGSLDDLKTTGFYGIDVASSSNAPSDVLTGSKCNITVNTASGLITQTLYYTSVAVYVRRFYNNAWNSWVKYSPIKTTTIEVTTDASGEYQTGDYTFNFISGYVKGEKTLVFCRVASNNERRLILRNSDNMTPIANVTKSVTYSYC